ncbi:MAG: hypothetical protein AB7O43_04800 [Hyphomicrobiaceae bacterium]
MVFQPAFAPLAAREMTRAEYETCRSADENNFKNAVEALTLKALQTGIAKIDYRALVEDEWRRTGIEEVLGKRIDIAVTEVAAETSLWEKGRSIFNTDKAQELAASVAERVYRADATKTQIEALASGAAKQMAGTIELAANDAAEPALACIRAFLGPRYGTTIARVVASDASREFQLDPQIAGAKVPAGSVLIEGTGALTGAVILVVRRQLARIATRIGQRIVGSVLGRLVSVVAGGVGLILIAKDIWDFRNGVLPIIATEMKSKASMDAVKTELANAISEQISAHTAEIAAATAERTVDIWRDFKRGHAKVVDLAERHEAFRAFIDPLKPSDLPRLDEVVALTLASEGEQGLLRRLADGSLAEAVTRLPDKGMEIARQTRSLGAGLAWTALAGPLLDGVLDFGLYRRANPEDFSSQQLKRLFALDDRLAAVRLAGISRSARDTLFELSDRDLKGLARSVTEPELETFASYLGGLKPQAREHVLRAVAVNPAKMHVLAVPRVRDAVLASRDQVAAVSMMLRTDSGFDVTLLRKDLELVYDGQISPVLLWDKHPIALVMIGGFVLILLLMVRRLFSRPRRRTAATSGTAA